MGDIGSGVIRSVFHRAEVTALIAVCQHGSMRPRLFFYSGKQHEYNTIAKTLFVVLL
ncbi:hypothetical protein [Herbaspirillum rhizosphaerae]|uniref:hypothetical protein n=1 Tax=Herbaspirillum rhizosphaerae TaxID=346179 RepID=UPI0012ED3D5B|nr:hypothetical protein [Herbaspirillum rhizosphaerae]